MSDLTKFRAIACAIFTFFVVVFAYSYGFPHWTVVFLIPWVVLSCVAGLAISAWKDKLRRLKAEDAVRYVMREK